MNKVVNIWYTKDITLLQTDSGYPTGILYELDDGRWLRQQSTDPMMPLEEIKSPKLPASKEPDDGSGRTTGMSKASPARQGEHNQERNT